MSDWNDWRTVGFSKQNKTPHCDHWRNLKKQFNVPRILTFPFSNVPHKGVKTTGNLFIY
jgi:hypothetical protein